MHTSYNSLTLLPLLKLFYLPFYKRGVRGAFFYGLGRAIIKGGMVELGGTEVLEEE